MWLQICVIILNVFFKDYSYYTFYNLLQPVLNTNKFDRGNVNSLKFIVNKLLMFQLINWGNFADKF